MDDNSRNEISELFAETIVRPLMDDFTDRAKNISEKNDILKAQEELEKTAKNAGLEVARKLKSTEKFVNQNHAAQMDMIGQVQKALSEKSYATQQMLQTASAEQKKVVLGQLAEQSKQTRDAMASGFASAEQKVGAVSRQLEGSEAKVLGQLAEQSKQTRDAMASGFSDVGQKLDALSRQVDTDEEKVLKQLAEIVQQLTENAASSSAQLTQYQQDLQTEMETGKSDLTETAMQKYKVLLGVSLSFGIVNFLGVVALLIINLMP